MTWEWPQSKISPHDNSAISSTKGNTNDNNSTISSADQIARRIALLLFTVHGKQMN